MHGKRKYELSDLDRVQLINQYQIIKNNLESGSVSQLFDVESLGHLIDVLRNGYTREYSDVFDLLFEEVDFSTQSQIREILNMYFHVYNAYEAHDEATRKKLQGLPGFLFVGFDGNNETEHMTYSEYLVIDKRLFSTVKHMVDKFGNDGFNSHTPMLERYLVILTRFTPIWDEVTKQSTHKSPMLSFEQLSVIFR